MHFKTTVNQTQKSVMSKSKINKLLDKKKTEKAYYHQSHLKGTLSKLYSWGGVAKPNKYVGESK